MKKLFRFFFEFSDEFKDAQKNYDKKLTEAINTICKH